MPDKELRWRNSALSDLLTFPVDVRKQAGFELNRVQKGKDPGDFKTISDWGRG